MMIMEVNYNDEMTPEEFLAADEQIEKESAKIITKIRHSVITGSKC